MLLTLEEFEYELRTASLGSMAASFRDFVSKLRAGVLPETRPVQKVEKLDRKGQLSLAWVKTHPYLQEAMISASSTSAYTDKWWVVVLNILLDVAGPELVKKFRRTGNNPTRPY